jgi:hypothetical protein
MAWAEASKTIAGRFAYRQEWQNLQPASAHLQSLAAPL